MAQENSFTIKGTIYKKEFTEVQGVKDPTQKYSKNIITLEVKTSREITRNGKSEYVSTTNLPQIEFFGVNLDDFSQGDFVQINFYLSGKEYKRKDGTKGIMTKPMGTYVKFADLDGGYNNHKGKITVESTSNPDDLPKAKRETVFVAPDPDGEDEGLNDLPFILTIPIAIGILLPIANNFPF